MWTGMRVRGMSGEEIAKVSKPFFNVFCGSGGADFRLGGCAREEEE